MLGLWLWYGLDVMVMFRSFCKVRLLSSKKLSKLSGGLEYG